MNTLFIFLAEYLTYVLSLYAVLHVLFKHERRYYLRHIFSIFGFAVIAWGVARVVKNIIAHPRPDLTQALIIPDSVYSFPSGHATYAMALAVAMYTFDKKAGSILILGALLVGLGRVLVGVHYWYDVIGGFIVGAVVAYIAVRLAAYIRTKYKIF